MDQPEDPTIVNGRNVRPRFDDSPQRDTENERSDCPIPAIIPRNAAQGGQHRKRDSPCTSPSRVSPLQPPRNAGPYPGPLSPRKLPNPAIDSPRTDGEPTPTLTEVNPEQGSITGGARIWLKGMDCPAHFPLFARFGTAVVPTVCLRDLRWGP